MSHVRLFYHIVFVTKHRTDSIPEAQERILFKYIHTVCIERGVNLIRINGTQCHIHMLVGMPSTICLSDFVRDIKRSTSMMMKRTPGFEQFIGWAREYSCDTVSFHHVDVIRQYIINQKQHHQTNNIIEELKSMFGNDVYNQHFD
ncbi:MAG: IS200/IS605 family transposase [Muribaculaceae bacterium]|nr:IS200/IS605 family transposase [Muribaculaceae bacterium]